ncbi:hypothetical protein P5G61_03020 [Paenibacillus sp. F6_3S_P_1C]|uniref:DNA-binding protein n=1 Tax=Paenibacillus vandeheii TaxID=3035917 RepID=A0ABT8J534_9BACL|nr:hypothetical protein [Paenibacillus vandeheii]MDN4600186.1 hypothetical protein [Paenibacillus vandeheii]
MSRYYDGYGLDSTVTLLRIAYDLNHWSEIIKLSEPLYDESIRIYNLNMLVGERYTEEIHTDRVIVYYIGYALLMRGIAHQKLLEFEKARECIKSYGNLKWLRSTDAETLNEIKYYTEISKVNLMVLDLLEGKAEALDEYLSFILQSKEELISGLLTLLEANRLSGLPINNFESLFEENIQAMNWNRIPDVDASYYLKFSYELSMYYGRNGRNDQAVRVLLNCASSHM